jgi:hypothetical protein
MSDDGPLLQTYRLDRHNGGRSWVLLPSGHQAQNPTHNRDAALIVHEIPAGSNPLISPRCLTLEIRAARAITLSVAQVRALLDEVGP